jgi:hypothetical protein
MTCKTLHSISTYSYVFEVRRKPSLQIQVGKDQGTCRLGIPVNSVRSPIGRLFRGMLNDSRMFRILGGRGRPRIVREEVCNRTLNSSGRSASPHAFCITSPMSSHAHSLRSLHSQSGERGCDSIIVLGGHGPQGRNRLVLISMAGSRRGD